MIEAIYPEARGWGAVFSSISKIVDEILVSFKKDGVTARAMDSAHLAMVDLVMPSQAFDSYAVAEDVSLGIKLDDLNNVLRRATKSDKLGISYEPKDNTLTLKFIGQIKREFTINLIELGQNTPPMPNLPVEVSAIVNPTALKEGIKDVGAVSDYAIFEGDQDMLYIRSRGNRGTVSLEFTKDSGYLLDYSLKSSNKKARASYGIKYLEFITAVDESVTVGVSFSANAPLKLEYQIPSDVKLTFLLAPRADEE